MLRLLVVQLKQCLWTFWKIVSNSRSWKWKKLSRMYLFYISRKSNECRKSWGRGRTVLLFVNKNKRQNSTKVLQTKRPPDKRNLALMPFTPPLKYILDRTIFSICLSWKFRERHKNNYKSTILFYKS